ncbi:MAG: DUF2569 family protein, partial [bacterium]
MSDTGIWYLIGSDQQPRGPLGDSELEELILSGRIPSTTLIRQQGMAEWMTVDAVFEKVVESPDGAGAPAPQLAAPVAGARPPPLPVPVLPPAATGTGVSTSPDATAAGPEFEPVPVVAVAVPPPLPSAVPVVAPPSLAVPVSAVTPAAVPPGAPRSLGGWLIFFVIVLCLQASGLVLGVILNVLVLCKCPPIMALFRRLTIWQPGILIDTGAVLVLVVLAALSLVCYFGRHRYAPVMVRIFQGAHFCVMLGSYGMWRSFAPKNSLGATQETGVITALLWAIAFVAYFSVSRRVKETFVCGSVVRPAAGGNAPAGAQNGKAERVVRLLPPSVPAARVRLVRRPMVGAAVPAAVPPPLPVPPAVPRAAAAAPDNPASAPHAVATAPDAALPAPCPIHSKPRLNNRFTVLRRVGEFAQIPQAILARDDMMQQQVMIFPLQDLAPAAVEQLAAHSRAVTSLNQASVFAWYGLSVADTHAELAGLTAGGHFLTMEYSDRYVAWTDPILIRRLRGQGLTVAARIAMKLAAVVDAVQEAGLWHAPLTSELLFLGPGNEPRLFLPPSLSLAGLMRGSMGEVRQAAGTRLPLPEGLPEATGVVQALARILFTVVTGSHPPLAAQELMGASDSAQAAAMLPARARRVLAKAMFPTPEGRFSSCMEFVSAIVLSQQIDLDDYLSEEQQRQIAALDLPRPAVLELVESALRMAGRDVTPHDDPLPARLPDEAVDQVLAGF